MTWGVLEHALLPVLPGREADFEAAPPDPFPTVEHVTSAEVDSPA